MILYPILKWYFDLVLALPSIIWGLVIISAFVLGLFGFSKLRGLILWLFGSPLVLFLICDLLKTAQQIPLLGIFAIFIRIAIDLGVITGVIKLAKLFFK